MIELLILLIKIVAVLNIAFGLAMTGVWIERKGSALLQDRVGANRAGAYLYSESIWLKPVLFVLNICGVLGLVNTLFCDPVKGFFKEDFLPEGTPQFVHCFAPFISALPIFLAYALIPIAPDFIVAGYHIRPQVAPLAAGVLLIFALNSISVYGPIIAGWCSNNKFSLLGGLRAGAQMISYELAMGVVLVTMALSYGTLDLYEMVEAQDSVWGILRQPLAAIILFIVGMAEIKRAPFDLTEAESELVAGFFTEYSGMKFLMFWMGEFAEIGLFSAVLVLMFFGGWHVPFVELPQHVWWAALIGHLVFMAKVLFFCVLQIVIRWTLPRFRYDQLMSFGWKMLFPLSLANLVVTALIKLW